MVVPLGSVSPGSVGRGLQTSTTVESRCTVVPADGSVRAKPQLSGSASAGWTTSWTQSRPPQTATNSASMEANTSPMGAPTCWNAGILMGAPRACDWLLLLPGLTGAPGAWFPPPPPAAPPEVGVASEGCPSLSPAAVEADDSSVELVSVSACRSARSAPGPPPVQPSSDKLSTTATAAPMP